MSSSSTHSGLIRVLPQEVVDRIKAGEVVQRAASAVKELVENALDAGATEIQISVSADCLSQLTVTDNGCGMSVGDLSLSVVRHATSKLRTTDDLQSLHSFGFRGEALASVCQVAQKVQITSRTAESPVGYTQSFHADNSNFSNISNSSLAKPTARKVGTTIQISNLFYNTPQRQKARPADEYQAILQVVQQYAILYADKGVGLVCQRTKKNVQVDLNTSAMVKQLQPKGDASATATEAQKQQVTKRVISQVYGSQLFSHLQYFSTQLGPTANDEVELPTTTTNTLANAMAAPPTCQCWGYLTLPSYAGNKRTTLILYINERLVECSLLKKSLEELFPNKPFCCLSLTVPPDHVDVNVHPTKKQVTLLHLEAIVQHIVEHVKEILVNQEQTFASNDIYKSEAPSNTAKKQSTLKSATPAASTTTPASQQDTAPTDDNRKRAAATSADTKETPTQSQNTLSTKRVRTSQATHAGAMEPFLIRTQSQSQSQSSQSPSQSQPQSSQSPSAQPQSPSQIYAPSEHMHAADCPLAANNTATADMSQPGAFAAAAAQCNCRRVEPIRLPRQALSRPKKVHPTPCTYVSIQQLRRRIPKRAWSTVHQLKLRTACFVGVVSQQRSLIQCGDELILLQHYEFARQLFYQLALYRFGGGAQVAQMGEGIDIATVIANFVQLEEDLRKPDFNDEATVVVSDSNVVVAKQAAACLEEHADLLQEYFSIVIEKNEAGVVVLTGLPVLLEGFEPLTHGLPLFLLRLATEVNWTEEKPCFHGICRELGTFYAQLPDDDDELTPFVRHTLFPAITTLLIPPQDLLKDNGFLTLKSLNSLYRVFERC